MNFIKLKLNPDKTEVMMLVGRADVLEGIVLPNLDGGGGESSPADAITI